LIGQWVKIRTRHHTGQQSYSTTSEASRVFPLELSFFDRKTSEALGNASFEGDRYNVVFKYLRQRSKVNGQKVTGQKVTIYIFYPGGQKVTGQKVITYIFA
jgi:hypothetical protein